MLDELENKFNSLGFSSMYIDSGGWESSVDQFKEKMGEIRSRILKEINRIFEAYHLD